MNFERKLDNAIKKNNSLLCVGLDPVIEKIPLHLQTSKYPLFAFNKAVIDATVDVVCCFKPNSAFYEAHGEKGIGELKMTCDYIKKTYPQMPILLDFKRGDIGHTNNGYAAFAFDYLQADAITVQPYLGKEALMPFLEREEKGIFILCKTSNPGSGEFQNVKITLNDSEESHSISREPSTTISTRSRYAQDDNAEPLYLYVAKKVANEWNTKKNCYLVVGATYPKELAQVRSIVGDMTLLVPGLGAQGGEVEKILKAGLNNKNAGMIINSSREIVYAGSGKDFAEKAREKAKKMKETINLYRNL